MLIAAFKDYLKLRAHSVSLAPKETYPREVKIKEDDICFSITQSLLYEFKT